MRGMGSSSVVEPFEFSQVHVTKVGAHAIATSCRDLRSIAGFSSLARWRGGRVRLAPFPRTERNRARGRFGIHADDVEPDKESSMEDATARVGYFVPDRSRPPR